MWGWCVVERMRPVCRGSRARSMTCKRAIHARSSTSSGRSGISRWHGPLGTLRPARRGAARRPHGRRVLLPLRADRAVGADAPADGGYVWFHVVTAGGLARGPGGERVALRPGDLALVPHGGGHVLRSEPGAPGARHPRPGARGGQPALRDPPPRRRRRADRPRLRRGAARPSGRPRGSSTRCPPILHVEARRRARRGLDGRDAAADGRRGARAAARRRGGDHAARRHPRHPDAAHLDRARPRRAAGLARRAARPPRRPGARAHPPRARARLDRRRARRRARDVALGVRRALHRRSSGSPRCSTSPAGACTSRSTSSPAATSRSPSSPTGSATAPRPPSRAPSSA